MASLEEGRVPDGILGSASDEEPGGNDEELAGIDEGLVGMEEELGGIDEGLGGNNVGADLAVAPGDASDVGASR